MDEEKPQVKSQKFLLSESYVRWSYRTSTMLRRTGSDGVLLEESKAPDTNAGQAEHGISRGIKTKGQSFIRMLKPGGNVETMQTLHNLNKDELAGFEESWNGNACKQSCQWKNKEEPKKKHNSTDEVGSGRGWECTRVKWDKNMSPAISPPLRAIQIIYPAKKDGAKKVVTIPI